MGSQFAALKPRMAIPSVLNIMGRVVKDRLELRAAGEERKRTPRPLQIMNGIDVRTDLTEQTASPALRKLIALDYLSGWWNSRPVRVGNGVSAQHQNDVRGMLLDGVAIHILLGAAQIVKPVWKASGWSRRSS